MCAGMGLMVWWWLALGRCASVCVCVCVCVSVSVYRVGWASLMVEWRATGDDERG